MGQCTVHGWSSLMANRDSSAADEPAILTSSASFQSASTELITDPARNRLLSAWAIQTLCLLVSRTLRRPSAVHEDHEQRERGS